jgi:hypothetical protein
MPGRVFISCGQSSQEERTAAGRVHDLLRDTFGLDPYLAISVQGLNDILRITDELRAADYYLFIDFVRNDNPSISIFTHQELALAHHLGFGEVIALQQDGAPRIGFLAYVQANPEPFSNTDDLIAKLEALVRDRGWKPTFSRNLVVEELGFCPLIRYGDHTGTFTETTFQVRVRNCRPDVAAPRSVCILDSIVHPDGIQRASEDRSYLKWAGQAGYERTILPQDFGDIDLLSIHTDQPGIFLHSLRDTPRQPIVQPNGCYGFTFKLFAEGFQLVTFRVDVSLDWHQPTQASWENMSSATLASLTRP